MSEKFSDNILLRIHRQYSKDESMKYLFEELAKLKFKIGEQKSEIEELKDNSSGRKEIAELKKEIVELNQIKNQMGKIDPAWRKEQYILDLKNQIQRRSERIKAMQVWQSKYLNLMARLPEEIKIQYNLYNL